MGDAITWNPSINKSYFGKALAFVRAIALVGFTHNFPFHSLP